MCVCVYICACVCVWCVCVCVCVVEMDGARLVGLGESSGSLTPGKQADLILLRTDRPNIFPINDPIGAVVWGMDTSNVDWVFVAGQAVMREGELQGDPNNARALATQAQDRLHRQTTEIAS